MSSAGTGKGKGKGPSGKGRAAQALANVSQAVQRGAQKSARAVSSAYANLEDRVDRLSTKIADSRAGQAVERFGEKIIGATQRIVANVHERAADGVAAAQAAQALAEDDPVEAARIGVTHRLQQAAGKFAQVVDAVSDTAGNTYKKEEDKESVAGNYLAGQAAQTAADSMTAAAKRLVQRSLGFSARTRRRAPARRRAPVRRPAGRRMRAAKVKVSRSGDKKAYCLRCRRKVQIVSPKMKRTKRGSPFLQGMCPRCNGKVACFQRK